MSTKSVRVKKPAARRRSSALNGSRKTTDLASLADEIIQIGRSVPLREWNKLPPDYFANLDAYRSGKRPAQ